MVDWSEDFIWSDVNPYTYMTEWIFPLLRAVAPNQKIIEAREWEEWIDSLKGNWPPIDGSGDFIFNEYMTSDEIIKSFKLPDDFTPDKLVDFFKLQPRTLRGDDFETRIKALNTPYLRTQKSPKMGGGYGPIHRVEINIPLIISKDPVGDVEDEDDWTQLLYHESLGLQITFWFNNKDVFITYGLFQLGILLNTGPQNTFDILELYLNPKKPPFMNWFTEAFQDG